MKNTKIGKKLMALVLVLATMISLTSVSFAQGSSTNADEVFLVSSPEFPEAYIITSYTPTEISTCNSDGPISLGKISATVFVENTYVLEDGKYVVSNSRLLSKEEVDVVGIENFQDMKTVSQTRGTPAIATKGALTIEFEGTYTLPADGGVKVEFNGNAKWAIGSTSVEGGLVAVGEDFIGITWAGNHSHVTSSCEVKIKNGSTGKVTSEWPTYADALPNAGRVWAFKEKPTNTSYAMETNVNLTIEKKTLEGGAGNTAEAVLKYVHTYEKPTGSYGISFSGPSYSVSGIGDNWSIICTVNKFPY